MFKILRHYGIPHEIVQTIQVLYEDTKSAVLVDGMLSEEFNVGTGVLQGNVLAPYLFIIVVDWILRQSDLDDIGFTTNPRRSRRIPETRISNLAFADDILLLANSENDAQKQLDNISNIAKEVGLIINAPKTKILSLNMPSPNIQLNGSQLENVKEFKYLGSRIASSEHDLNYRKGNAWDAFWKLRTVWLSDTSLNIKINLYKASVLSILMYGCETWVLTSKMEKKCISNKLSTYNDGLKKK